MIEIDSAREILATYKKYGWQLRRILGRPESRQLFFELADKVPFEDFDLEAAWFSRTAGSGPVAWEIRYLGDPPFALLENFDEADTEFPAKRRAVENRLMTAIKGRLDKS